MRKKWLARMMALVMLLGCITPVSVHADVVASDAWYGDGTAEVFTLNTTADLLGFANLVDGGNSFAGKTVKLGADIDLSDVANFPIIGNDNNTPFSGTFDGSDGAGGCYAISNMTITATGQYAGLFACLNGATVENITLVSPTLTTAYQRTGLVAGAVYSATAVNTVLDNITVTGGGVNSTHTSGWVGGLVGAGMKHLRVENCSVGVTVTGVTAVGGVVGYVANSAPCTIEDCTVNANVTSTAASGASNIGGVVGYTNASGVITVTGCTVSAALTGDGTCMGGVIGQFANSAGAVSITNCGVTTTISGSANTDRGGVVGWHNGNGALTIENCAVDAAVSGTKWLGGVVGQTAGTGKKVVQNCTVSGTVTGSGAIAGGVIGYNSGAGAIEVSGCTVSGTITNSGGNVGGMIGYQNQASSTISVAECWFSGTANSTTTSAYAAGILGYINAGAGATITSCTITGAIGTGSTKWNAGILGGLKPSATVTVEDSAVVGTLGGLASGTGAPNIYAGYLTAGTFNLTCNYTTITGKNDYTKAAAVTVTATALANNSFNGQTLEIGHANGLLTMAYLSRGTTFSGAVLQLTADINMAGIDNFPMIGQYDLTGTQVGKIFAGKFDGDGKEISNLTVSSTGRYVGLFSDVNGSSGGYIKNLRLRNPHVATTTDNANANGGILVGYVNAGSYSIENVSIINGSMSAPNASKIGGLLGTNNSTTEVKQCSIHADIVAKDKVGGVVGEVYGNTVTVSNSLFDGTVTSPSADRAYMGGIAGYLQSDTATLNATDVLMSGTVSKEGNAFVGGIVGQGAGSSPVALTRVLVTGTVAADSGCVGAIIGNNTQLTGTITDSYALDTSCAHGNSRGGLGAAIVDGKISDGATILTLTQLTGVNARINAPALDYSTYWVAVEEGAPQLQSFRTGTASDTSVVYDVSTYRTGTFTAPEAPAGKIFAGWYLDGAYTEALDAETVEGLAIAKWVDQNTLYVRYQFKANDSLSNDIVTMRILTTTDSQDYQKVIFSFDYNAKNKSFESTHTFSSVSGKDKNGNSITYFPTSKCDEVNYYWSADSAYICGYNINIPSSLYDTSITMTPKWITADGTVVSGVARTITVRTDNAFKD